MTPPVNVGECLVVEGEASEEDLADSAIVSTAVPIGGGLEVFRAVVNGGGEDVWYVRAASGTKLTVGTFNLLNLRSDITGLLPIRFDKGGETVF
ncbi:MGMT family protein [Babesia caballi]|uniref:MGMT family protein n=1 Tax=Babesia caballi TaxID=5871 RepID=A0AAV4LX33_BABCB|nr:MGMT family protein [Babesia caballi]